MFELADSRGACFLSFIPLMPFGKGAELKQLTADRMLELIREIDKAIIETSIPASLWCMPFAKSIAQHAASYSCRLADIIDIGVSGEVLLCDVRLQADIHQREKPSGSLEGSRIPRAF